MPFTEDFTEFFSDFDKPTTWKGIAIKGILDREYIETSMVSGFHPIFTCEAADVPGAAQGDAIIVDSVAYTIRETQPDGTGIMRLILEAV